MISSKLFDASIVGDLENPVDLITNILQASTEYSMIGKDLDGKILLWNEGARRIYGYEPEEVVGIKNSSILHIPEDIASGKDREIMASALRDGKWEGSIKRIRKNGERFTAKIVLTPRLDMSGKPIGFLLISKDITEEIFLAEKLKSIQFYTRSLIESSIDALVTTDLLGNITDVNQQMVFLTGYSHDQLINSPFKNYFTDQKSAERGIMLALSDNRVTNYELTAVAKDGRETVVSYNATIFRDSKETLQGVFVSARDITEQKKMEQQLRNSQLYTRSLIEASVDGFITVDPENNITDVNEQMCRISGYSREELVGTPFADYFVDTELALAGIKETFIKGAVTDYVLMLATHDNKKLNISFNASVFCDPNGEVRGIFASARDITEQAKLQLQLSEERTYNRGLIEASLDGLITVDPMLVITDVNETMCRMSGFSRQELLNSPFPQYFTDSRHAAKGVRLTLDKGEVTNYELTLQCNNGTQRLVSFNAAIFKNEVGDVRGIFASARDITEEAILRAQLSEERTYNRGLIEASVDGLVTVNQEMIITDVNETMCRMVGRPRNQLIGVSFPAYFTEPERAAEGVRLTFRENSVADYVLTLLTAAGNQLLVSFNAAVFKDTTGDVCGIFASARDISSQKQLEEKLQASQFYSRSLIESNMDALMTTDQLGIITDVNQQMETLTACAREKLIGTPFKQYFTDPEIAEKGIRLVLQKGRVKNYELSATSLDKKTTIVSYNATTFYDQAGHLQGVFAAARDITEQKKFEQELRAEQNYLRGLIESSADGLVTVDLEGIITDINNRMCQMTGYIRAELLGTPFSDYFTEPECARAGIKQTLEVGFVTEYALTLLARSRRTLQVSFNASTFKDPNGDLRGILVSARDVTDRMRLEEQMREQQLYLRGLIESSVDGLVTVDPEGFVTDVNEQMCRMSGYTRLELIGSTFKQYFTDPERAQFGVKHTFAEASVTNYELELISKSKRKSTVSFNASIFRSSDGNIQGIFASARDISEQSRLQTKLVEQQVYNRSLIEASPDALFAIAPDGTIIDVNEEAIRITGYSRKNLVNSPFANYFTDPEQAIEGVRKTLETHHIIGYELKLHTRHGRRIMVSFNAGVFTDIGGSPLGILGAARDITSQKELESQLIDSQFYTRSLIESNIDALMTTNPLGIIMDVNQQMITLTGYSREELIGSPFKKYCTDHGHAEQGIRQVLQEKRVINYELTILSKMSTETVVSYNATTFYDQDGKLKGVFAAARDITERKLFEKALQEKNMEMEKVNDKLEAQQGSLKENNARLHEQAERLTKSEAEMGEKSALIEAAKKVVEIKAKELELATKYKSEFLANMSHELRTPLNSLLILAEILANNDTENLTRDQVESAKIIHKGGKDLLGLINDILDLSKVEAGKLELFIEDVSLKSTVKNLQQLFVPIANDKGIKFNVKIDDFINPTIKTDSQRIEQILKNFLSNAFKFTEAGIVNLNIHKPNKKIIFQLPTLSHDRCIGISVIDTGIGIPESKQKLIFEAFQQAEGHTSRTYGGTGLGLSISLELARMLNCEIHLKSMVGEGSTFTLYVPIQYVENTENNSVAFNMEKKSNAKENQASTKPLILKIKTPTSPAETHSILENKKILLVDDDMRNMFALTQIFRGKGLVVIMAENGKVALEKLKTEPGIDIVLMDIMMPIMDGYEAMKKIREEKEFEKLPIIALTAKVMPEDKAKAIASGASDFMTKPVNTEELLKLMCSWLTNINIPDNKLEKV